MFEEDKLTDDQLEQVTGDTVGSGTVTQNGEKTRDTVPLPFTACG